MPTPFTHLHVHSEYSLLDGLSKLDHLTKRVKELGMESLALTDHGSMHGAVEFYIKAKKNGIKPIIGMEGYVANRSRFDKEAHIDREPFHILLLAKNLIGYKNLMKLTTSAHLEGFYYKPRLDHEVLKKYSEGLIVLSGCPDGEIPRALLANDFEKAKKLTHLYMDIFGQENFFFEVQHHLKTNGTEIEVTKKSREEIFKLALEFDRPVVATNDLHYVDKDDALAQDALLAIQTKETLDSPKRKLSMIDSPTFYLRSPEEMLEIFYDHPEVIANSQKVVELCNLELQLDKVIYPHFISPSGFSAGDYLKKLTYERLSNRYGENPAANIKQRIEYELGLIIEKGYADYFLIAADYVNWAKSQGIAVGPGRGSGAASIVAYIMGITSIDPLQYNLPFERFLNVERISTPDFDIDFADFDRDRVIEYVKGKYGEDRVAQIVTFGSMEARAAVRDVGRVMSLPYSYCDRLAKMIPIGAQGSEMTIERALSLSPDLKKAYETEAEAKKLLDLAKKVDGCKRHASVHAAGVVISDEPLVEYVPLMRDSKEGNIITQYNMYSLDLNSADLAVGLIKMDFLGLRNLSIIQKTLELLREERKGEIDLDKIPLDVKAVYEMLSKADTIGVFQLESAGMRRVLKDLKPSNITDIAAVISLFRPGPMDLIPQFIESKRQAALAKYPHPDLKPILEDTYGVMVFQEQCLQVANVLAGYSLGQADLLRRAIGKKKKDLMEKEHARFLKGAQDKGYTAQIAEKVWGFIEKFAGYGFNRAHAASYALIAYQTAYLKYHYPVEYMTALLSCEFHNEDKVSAVVSECRRMGLEVLPPNVNESGVNFAIFASDNPQKNIGLGEAKLAEDDIVNQSIRFGLAAIKNVGEGAAESIIKERQKDGPYRGLDDLLARIDLTTVNKKVLESLIKVGACDIFGGRGEQLMILGSWMEEAALEHKKKANGLRGLFEEDNSSYHPKVLPSGVTFLAEQQLTWEKELLGFYLSPHPKLKTLSLLSNYVSHSIAELSEQEVGSVVTVGGMITSLRKIITKKDQQEMAFVKITDQTGSLEVIVFPKIFQNGRSQIVEDEVVLISGRLDNKEETEFKIIAEKIVILGGSGQPKEVSKESLEFQEE